MVAWLSRAAWSGSGARPSSSSASGASRSGNACKATGKYSRSVERSRSTCRVRSQISDWWVRAVSLIASPSVAVRGHRPVMGPVQPDDLGQQVRIGRIQHSLRCDSHRADPAPARVPCRGRRSAMPTVHKATSATWGKHTRDGRERRTLGSGSLVRVRSVVHPGELRSFGDRSGSWSRASPQQQSGTGTRLHRYDFRATRQIRTFHRAEFGSATPMPWTDHLREVSRCRSAAGDHRARGTCPSVASASSRFRGSTRGWSAHADAPDGGCTRWRAGWWRPAKCAPPRCRGM